MIYGNYGRKVVAKCTAIYRCAPFFVDLALSVTGVMLDALLPLYFSQCQKLLIKIELVFRQEQGFICTGISGELYSK